jgi:predicted amidohydrolase YtcJ
MSRTSASKQQAELVLSNGNFITLDDNSPRASAMAVKNGRILRIGDFKDVKGLIGKNTVMLDLKGKTVVPGFIDAHIHLISLGLAMQVLDLRAISSKSDMLERVKLKADLSGPGSWIRGYGFDDSILELPTKLELDKVSPENPVYLEAVNHTTCILNSLAFLKVGAKDDSAGVKMDRYRITGEVNGVIRVDNRKLLIDVVRIPTIEPLDENLEEAELVEAIMIAYPKIVEQGITSIHDVQMPPNGLKAYNKVVKSGEMPLRVYAGCDRNKEIDLEKYINEGLGSEPHPERLKIGLVKLFADGRMTLEEFSRRAKEAHEAGYQLAIHSDDKTRWRTRSGR